jgi:hypothetical protein
MQEQGALVRTELKLLRSLGEVLRNDAQRRLTVRKRTPSKLPGLPVPSDPDSDQAVGSNGLRFSAPELDTLATDPAD